MKALAFTLTCLWLCPLAIAAAGSAAPSGEPPSMSLEEAKELARQNSPTLQITQEKLVQAETIVDKAWAMVKPQWNATGSYTHYNEGVSINFPNITIGMSQTECGDLWNPQMGFCIIQGNPPSKNMTIQKQDTFSFYTTINQPLFLARALSTIKSAYQARDLARINVENARDYLLYSLEVAYYGALTTRKFMEIANHAVEIRKEHLKDAQAKFEVGETPKITVLRAEIDVNRAEQDAKRSESALGLAKEAIRLLAGIDHDFSMVEPKAPEPTIETLDQYLKQALTQRRDLTSARLNLELAEQGKADAWYRFLPSLYLTGLYRISDVKGINDKYYLWTIGLTLTVPLYDGGLRYAYLDEASSKIREANVTLEQTRQSIASEIRQLWLKREMAQANLVKARRSVELARDQVELAKASFEAGATTNLEVLDANSMLFISEISAAEEELNLELANLRLEKSVRMYNPMGSLSTGGGGLSGGEATSMDAGGASMGGSALGF